MQRKELKSCRVMVEKGAASQPFVYFNHRHVFNDQSTPAPPPHLLCKGDYYAGGGGGTVMAENHIKTNSSGLQHQAYCCYEQEDSSQT